MSLFKVDVHTHILPKEYPDLKARYGYGGFIRLEHIYEDREEKDSDGNVKTVKVDVGADMYQDEKFFRRIEPNCYCPHARREDMKKTGVDVQVLSTVPVMFSYWAKPADCLDLCRLLNDDIAATVKSDPKHFVGLGTLPMQAPELAVQELRRCMLELNLAGVEIGTHINDWNLDDPELFPIFQEAERLGAAIFVHPWDMMAKDKMPNYWLPWLVGMPAETSLAICSLIFSGVFERLPKLKVCFAHGCGSFPGTLARIEHGFNVRPDLCAVNNKVNPREYCGRFWSDSLTHDKDQLDLIIKLMGSDKIVLGSDYPFPLGEHHPGLLIEKTQEYTEELKRKLLGENIMTLLGVKQEDFVE